MLYHNSSAANTVYRLDPDSGAVLGTAAGDGFADRGLSYHQIGGTDYLYYSHAGVDVHRQIGFGGAINFFFSSLTPTAGLGGDGYGREFAIVGATIREYDASSAALIGPGFAAPSGAQGLAFDGSFLYVSTEQGLLLTLDPNTGAVLNTVTPALRGSLIELGASVSAVPEPATIALLGAGLAAALSRRRARR